LWHSPERSEQTEKTNVDLLFGETDQESEHP